MEVPGIEIMDQPPNTAKMEYPTGGGPASGAHGADLDYCGAKK